VVMLVGNKCDLKHLQVVAFFFKLLMDTTITNYETSFLKSGALLILRPAAGARRRCQDLRSSIISICKDAIGGDLMAIL